MDQNATSFKLFFNQFINRIKMLSNVLGFDIIQRINNMLYLHLGLIIDMVHKSSSSDDYEYCYLYQF